MDTVQQSRCLKPSLTPRQRAHEIEKSNQKNLEAAPSIQDGMQKAKLHHRPVAPDLVTKFRTSQQTQGTTSRSDSKGLRKMVASSVDVAATAVFRRPHRNKQRQGEKQHMEVEVARSESFFSSFKRNLAQLWGGST